MFTSEQKSATTQV